MTITTNRHKRAPRYLAILVASGFATTAAYAPPFNLTEVAPGNFVHYGKHVTFEDKDHDDIANIGFIVGERCVAIVDTGGSISTGEALKAAMAERTQVPVCYVINTHVHFDHLLGNAAFTAAAQPKFVGHANLADAVASNVGFFLKNYGGNLGPQPSAAMIIGPDTMVDSTLELDLGGRKLLLRAWPKAHTNADLTVLDQATGTLWLGDLLFRERIPSLDGSIKGWLAVIEELQGEKVGAVIPGHGPAGDDLRVALAAEKQYLEVLVKDVRGHLAAGDPIDQAAEQAGASEQGRWQLWEQHHKRNVSKVYTELEWE
jgi:quinoprotein relay system zinc metallohydrolase 2